MPREGQPATPPGGGGMRGPRPPTSNPRTGAPPRRPRPEPQPTSRRREPQPGSPRRESQPTSPRPGRAPTAPPATSPAPTAVSASRRTGPPPESSAEHHWEEALDHLRPSRAWTAFKKAGALTRWVVLLFVVGLGAAAIVAIALAALFTLVDSSV